MSIATPPAEDLADLQEVVSQNPGLAPFFENLASFVELPKGVEKLREMVLQLAVRGDLQTSSPDDPPAIELANKIRAERERQITEKIIRRGKKLPAINPQEHSFTIPKDWAWVQFGELGDWGAGATPRRGDARYYDGDIVWLKSGELNYGIVTDSEEKITQAALDDCSLRMNQPGDVLIAMYGATIGKLAIAGVECTTNQAVCACTCFEGVFNEYLFLLLKAFKSHFIKKSSGAAQPNYSKEKIVRTSAALPPLAEQQRIVAKVESLMALCDTLEEQRRARESCRQRATRSVLASLTSAPRADANRQSKNKSGGPANPPGDTLATAWQRLSDHFEVLLDQPESLAQLRQSILQLAVQGKLVEQDSKDEPSDRTDVQSYHERRWNRLFGDKKYKAPSQPDEQTTKTSLPNPWCWASVDELADPEQPISYGILKPGPFVDGGIRMLRIVDLKNGVVNDEAVHRISQGLSDQYSRTLLSGGEILISLVGTIGLCAIVPSNLNGSNVHRNLGVILPGAYITADYLLTALNSGTVREQITEATKGGNQPLFNLGDLKSIAIPLPPLAEQKRIVSKVDSLLSQCDELATQYQKRQATTEQLLTSLIHRILEGGGLKVVL